MQASRKAEPPSSDLAERFSILSAAVLLVVLSVACGTAQQKSSHKDSLADIRNPATATPAAQARAKEIYGYDCSMCHGETGAGGTTLDTQVGITTPDMTDPTTMDRISDRELYTIIWSGKGK